MKSKLLELKNSVVELYEKIKEMDEQVFSLGFGNKYHDIDNKKEPKRIARKNNVRVEDLRPQRPDSN